MKTPEVGIRKYKENSIGRIEPHLYTCTKTQVSIEDDMSAKTKVSDNMSAKTKISDVVSPSLQETSFEKVELTDAPKYTKVVQNDPPTSNIFWKIKSWFSKDTSKF